MATFNRNVYIWSALSLAFSANHCSLCTFLRCAYIFARQMNVSSQNVHLWFFLPICIAMWSWNQISIIFHEIQKLQSEYAQCALHIRLTLMVIWIFFHRDGIRISIHRERLGCAALMHLNLVILCRIDHIFAVQNCEWACVSLERIAPWTDCGKCYTGIFVVFSSDRVFSDACLNFAWLWIPCHRIRKCVFWLAHDDVDDFSNTVDSEICFEREIAFSVILKKMIRCCVKIE